MHEGIEIVQPIRIVSLEEIAGRVASEEREEEDGNKNVKALLNIFSKNAVKVLADLGKERLHNQICVQSSRIVHLSVSSRGFVKGWYAQCLMDYMKCDSFNHDRMELWKRVQCVLGK